MPQINAGKSANLWGNLTRNLCKLWHGHPCTRFKVDVLKGDKVWPQAFGKVLSVLDY